MAWVGTAHARAKINLTLHILGRRDDGYHDLESLVSFAAFGDDLRLVEGPRLSLTIAGPEADVLTTDDHNHIIKATHALQAKISGLRVGAFHLTKRLPLASGMGGGSADAAAALRLLARLNHLALDDPHILAAARATGADVTVCLESRTRIMRGIGDALDAPFPLPRIFAVLVNPRRASETPRVFETIGLKRGETKSMSAHPLMTPMADYDRLIALLRSTRNDMESAAISLEPAIAQVIDAVKALPDCHLARMSGSGATVFGLFPTCRDAARGARLLRERHPHWWIKSTLLGPR